MLLKKCGINVSNDRISIHIHSVVLVERKPVFLMVKKVECSLQSHQWTEHTPAIRL